jgi:hypothetical protein
MGLFWRQSDVFEKRYSLPLSFFALLGQYQTARSQKDGSQEVTAGRAASICSPWTKAHRSASRFLAQTHSF